MNKISSAIRQIDKCDQIKQAYQKLGNSPIKQE